MNGFSFFIHQNINTKTNVSINSRINKTCPICGFLFLSQGKLHRTRLVIMKRAAEDRYLGELYIDRSEWTTNKCCFELGTAPLKDKYIQQFIEIFTEEGRKQVGFIALLYFELL